ncbi:hypothetical protein JCM17844_23840 [Iodidimonas gelatinilytica]|uniref:Glutamate synthase [NADPH] small chain n=1 Tax=Iodidimonas gelatinilytica TaxID=1236966 RepID=A0A5A7MY27_9PROT|nr:hypothetical protein [Iodidimonas gelatinilytica]GEQ98747.1 hypothetical protein JCM17844_23840 [Iodidimonas gelatinilytica]GER00893.1 hypothetical protein JCM17845_15160 [Iodidimonas gelatinilytica]
MKTDHRSMTTSIKGVFAAGDIVRGASLVVWAVRDGQDAASAIDRYLKDQRNPKPETQPDRTMALETVS